MNKDALARLAENAMAFGRTYAALKEALILQGVKEQEAVEVARNSAQVAAMWDDEMEHAPECPLCDGGGFG